MPKQPLIVKIAVTAIVIIILLAAMDIDPGPFAQGVVSLLFWMLPGLILSAIALALATAITKSLPLGAAAGGITLLLYIMFRLLFWGSR